MKILITNNHLTNVGGTETWVKTVADELKRRGHEVHLMTSYIGKFAEGLDYLILWEFVDNYDLILCNHTTQLERIKTDTPIIFTSHSFFIDIEQPIKGADAYVAVIEEIAEKQKEFNPTVIRNGIDLEKFKSTTPINKELKTVLYLSHPWNKKALPIIKEACKDYELITIEQETNNVETLINKADLVITLGRGILESLACGRNVISADWRSWMQSFSGGGVVTKDNFNKLKTHAFSGRNKPIEFTAERLKQELEKYSPDNNLRHLMEKECDIKKQVDKYLNLWTTIKSDI